MELPPAQNPPPPPYSPPAQHTSLPTRLQTTSDTSLRQAGAAATAAVPLAAAAAAAPSHDYTAYQQVPVRASVIVADQSFFSTGPQPTTVPVAAEPNNAEQFSKASPSSRADVGTGAGSTIASAAADTSTSSASSAAYFASRQAPREPFGTTLFHRLVLPPNARASQLPFPQPEHAWLSRDVNRHDWMTFTNHLLPYVYTAPEASAAHNVRAEKPSANQQHHHHSSTMEGGGAPLRSVVPRRKPPQSHHHHLLHQQSAERTDVAKNPPEKGGGEGVSGASGEEPEAQRKQRILDTVVRWNEGFFAPRALHVDVDVLPYSSPPLAHADDHLATSRSLGEPRDSILPMTSTGSLLQFEPQSSASRSLRAAEGSIQPKPAHQVWGPGPGAFFPNEPPLAASFQTTPSYHHADRPMSRTTSAGTWTAEASSSSAATTSPKSVVPDAPQVCDNATAAPAQQQPAPSAQLPDTVLTSSSPKPGPAASSSAAADGAHSDNDNDNGNGNGNDNSNTNGSSSKLEDADIRQLRGAFAEFLLSSRSREETAVALQQLNEELQARRQATAKELKAQMKQRRRDIKALARQHKAEQRAEKKRQRAAEKARQADLQALRRDEKALKKRQKEAVREAKMFRKNAKKAVSGKEVAEAPYKGWLDTLEMNQQESGTVRTSG